MTRDCCRPDYDAVFNHRAAARELAAYRRDGATGTTRRLLEAIRQSGVTGARVLDIGGGVGVIGAELLGAGASHLTDVDASQPYLEVARSEIERRGYAERAAFLHGDFVELADEVEPAEIVTLDRVICCYAGWTSLVDRSLGRARVLYGLVYPRDRWWLRLSVATIRAVGRLFGQALPFHVHPEQAVDARIRAAGFEPIFARRGLMWQTILYRRTIAQP